MIEQVILKCILRQYGKCILRKIDVHYNQAVWNEIIDLRKENQTWAENSEGI